HQALPSARRRKGLRRARVRLGQRRSDGSGHAEGSEVAPEGVATRGGEGRQADGTAVREEGGGRGSESGERGRGRGGGGEGEGGEGGGRGKMGYGHGQGHGDGQGRGRGRQGWRREAISSSTLRP